MALTNTCVRFLAWAKQQGISFESTLTLGHLDNIVSRNVMDELAKKNPGLLENQKIDWNDRYADSILSAFGASRVTSLDKTDFEKADLIYDLNLPLPESLHG